jgi:saccharopine dehydrogenase (NAD+, L-lysine-forming)
VRRHRASVKERFGVTIDTAAIDADDVAATTALINAVKPALVVNLALPYQDLNIMDACLAAGVNYMDTANYEPRDEAKFEYKWQWAYQDRFKDAGLMALLGSGFDPGVTSVFTTWTKKHLLDRSRRSTSWTATAATPACPSRPTSIPKSTCAK